MSEQKKSFICIFLHNLRKIKSILGKI